MDTWQIIAMALIPIVIGPWIARLKRKRRKIRVVVRCPHCQADIGLERLRTYICGSCHATVAFFTTPKNEILRDDLETYGCGACGATNPEGVVTCLACGTPNVDG